MNFGKQENAKNGTENKSRESLCKTGDQKMCLMHMQILTKSKR